jgi:hypothetical protein
MQGRASIEDILPTMQQARDVGLLTLMVFLVVVIWTGRKQINEWALWFIDRYLTVHYVASDDHSSALDDRISAHQEAETAKAETRNAPGATATIDIAAIRREAKAEALGSLLAHGLLAEGGRTKAMRAVFGAISGDAYSRAKGAVDRAEAQVSATLPPPTPPAEPPRILKVYADRPGLEREIEMEPAP